MAVGDLVASGVGGAIGAYVVFEIVESLEYTGTGEDLLPLLSFVIIAVAIMNMMDSGM